MTNSSATVTMEQLRACQTLMREIEAIERMRGRVGDYRNGLASIAFAEGYFGGGNMRESAAWQALEGVEKVYRDKIEAYARAVFLVEQAIAELPPDQREIMRLRYIVGCRWAEIASTVNYAREYCWRVHNKALNRLGILV